MLLGEFEQRLDDKNRVTLPARLRSAFETGAICARGLDGCVVVYPLDSWDAYVSAQSDRLDPFSNAVRVTILTLRRKLGEPPVILTIPSNGYRLA